ncbi:MAG: AAA family ATPase [Chloroflexi bacterium]|nr:AAA family ATPase [Chloroflexota bacterium]
MRLRRIELPGFGCLQSFQTDLAPGLNLFHGLNEAGKSTLQQAVLALLYGFYDHDRARPDETARYERFRPWAGPDYRGLLEYELNNGRRFQVRRDFITADIPTQLVDLTTGQDIAPQFGRGRHGNLPFARRHLGMSRAVFQSCAFISQGEIFEVSRGASPREIGDAIASLADSARRDVSATNAIQRLNNLIAKIGTDRARTADLPRARDHLRTAQRELQALDQARQTLADKAAEVDHLQSRLAELQDEFARTDVLLTRSQTVDLAGRLQDLRDVDQALSRSQARQEELKPYATVPTHLRDEIQDLSGRRHTTTGALQRLQTELAEAGAALDEETRLQYAPLQAEVGSLSPDQLLALERLAYTPPAPGRRLPAALLTGAGAIGRALAALMRRLIRIILRRQAAPAQEPASPPPLATTPAEAVLLLEKHRRFLTLRPALDNLARLQAEESRTAAALTAIDSQLQGLLATAATAEHSDIQTSIATFLQACDLRREYEAALAAEEQVAKRRRALLHGRSPQELERQHQQLVRNLQRLLALHPNLEGSESDQTLEELAARLDSLRQEREETQLRHTQRRTEIDYAFAQHRPHPEIEEEIERWQRQVSQLERARAAAQLAKDTIEEAVTEVYRDFAPRVNEFLSQGVDYVTQGHYTHAFVDPSTLQISLDVPEINRTIADPPVSHGTLALMYVLMRIGLAQHMSSIGEPVPLVLDDPFVDIDSQRLPRLLDFLARLSQERGIQILLFSKDDHTLRWFEDSALEPQHRLYHLPPLDEPRATVATPVLDHRLL